MIMYKEELKKFRISYYYLALGMEGNADIFPEKIIEAPTKELAAYIYSLMFFAATDLGKIESLKSYGGGNFSFTTFEQFLKESDSHKYWGMSIKEVL